MYVKEKPKYLQQDTIFMHMVYEKSKRSSFPTKILTAFISKARSLTSMYFFQNWVYTYKFISID